MTKTATLTKPESLASQQEAELDGLLRQMQQGLKRMKKLDAEIADLGAKTRASLARLKAS
jgi:hypothetical protein